MHSCKVFNCTDCQLLRYHIQIPLGHYDHSIPVKQDVVPLRVINDTHLPKLHETSPSTAIIIKLEGIALEIQSGADEATITHTINALRHLC